MRFGLITLAVAAPAACLLVGCASPRFALGAPPTVPSSTVLQAPSPPVAEQDKAKQDDASVKLDTHKTRGIPGLQQKLIGLIPIGGASADVADVFEDRLIVRLVDYGITRIVPGAALASVSGQVDQPDPTVKGSTVRLSAPLSSLALVTRASRADYLVYGELSAGETQETREVGYSMDASALAAYTQAYGQFAATLRADSNKVSSTCSRALGAYESEMSQFKQAGGVVGGKEDAGIAAATAESQYSAFEEACNGRRAAINQQLASAPTPEVLQQSTGQKRGVVNLSYTRVTAMISVRDSASDETFWIGRFEATAPSLSEGVAMVADRVAAELAGRTPVESVPATPAPVTLAPAPTPAP